MTFIIFIGYDRKRKAERMRLPDDMFCNTCKSTLLHIFFRNSCFTKKACRLPPTYKFELGISWFSINHRSIDNQFSYEKVSCLKWVLRKRRYTENLLLKYVVRRVILVYRPPKSVLIIDNAPYHNIQVDKCPTQASRKADIQAWLKRQQIPFGATLLKAELLQICKQHKPTPNFLLDNILKEYGHDCLRLPAYHADLNSIELIWATTKG